MIILLTFKCFAYFLSCIFMNVLKYFEVGYVFVKNVSKILKRCILVLNKQTSSSRDHFKKETFLNFCQQWVITFIALVR